MAQRKTDRKNLRGEQTRELILRETMRLTARHGYEGTKMSMIRQATGVSASSIYWHFGTKDHLVAAALEHAFREHSRAIPEWLDPSGPQSRTADLYRNLHRVPRIDPDLNYWRFGLQLAVIAPPVAIPARARFLQIRRESVAWLVRWWERSLPEGMEQREAAALALARLTVGMRDSQFIQRPDHRPLDEERITWLLSACLDAAAGRAEELASRVPLDAVRASVSPFEAAGPAGAEGVRGVFLRAAEDSITEFGYDGVTVTRVCERAELPASSLYWLFRDKQDLMSTVIAHACHRWESVPLTLQPRPADGDWRPILRGQLRETLTGLGDGTRTLRLGLLLLLQRSTGADDGRHDLELVLQDMQGVTRAWLRSVLSPQMPNEARADLAQDLAECLFRLLAGMMLSRQIDEGPWDPDVLADLMSSALYRVAALVEGGTLPPADPD